MFPSLPSFIIHHFELDSCIQCLQYF
jgi:hypothetical protein